MPLEAYYILIYPNIGVLAIYETSEQEGSEGLLWEDQASHGPGDYDQQGQVKKVS